MTPRQQTAAATTVGGRSPRAQNETADAPPSALSLNIAPSLHQVADAILNHYGPTRVGSMEFDDLRDATMMRTIIAGRLLRQARHDVPAALACIGALSMETAHETPFDDVADLRPDTDAEGEFRIVAREPQPEPSNRVKAWTENPVCVHCGEKIADPRDSGALYGTKPLRVAHVIRPGTRSSCFVFALAKMRNAEIVATIIPRALDRSGLEIR